MYWLRIPRHLLDHAGEIGGLLDLKGIAASGPTNAGEQQRAVSRPSWPRKLGHDVDRIDLNAGLQQVSLHRGNTVAAVVIAPVGNHD